MAKLSSIIGLLLCYTTCISMINISQQLIGFQSGPSAEIACIEKQQLVQSKLNKILEQIDEYTTIESANMILEQYDKTYQDYYTLILRDAGKISAIYVLLLVLFPKFSDTKYSKRQRMWILMATIPLFIAPSMLSQVFIQNTVPIESTILNTFGFAKGLAYIEYCSGRSLLIGLGIGVGTLKTIIHETKVVATAALFMFVTRGLIL